MEIRDGQLLNDVAQYSTFYVLLGLARQNYYLEDVSGRNYPISKSSPSRMRFEIATKRWREEKRQVYADCQRNARESEIREGDKVLLRQEKENKLSTPYKQSPFTVIQKKGNSVLVEADGV